MRHSSIAAFATFVLAACTGKSPEPLPKYPDANAYCNGRAQAECNDTVIVACAAPGKDKCISSRQSACVAAAPKDKAYDASKTEDCIAAVAAAYGDAKLTKDEIKTYTDTCALLFNGIGVKDSPCGADADCKVSEGLRCVVSSSAGGADGGPIRSSGTCQLPKIVQGGDSCAPVDAMCAAGYHCGLTKHCDINGATGEACGDGLPCKETLKCSSAGMCQPKLADGSPCTVSQECTNGVCLEQTNICVSQVILAPNEPFCVQAR
jgi:hypothetical protein